MKQAWKISLIIACIAAAALCELPVMSVYLSGGESGTLYVRGYNLMEFSVWGCVPVLAPILILPVLCGNLSKGRKRTVFWVLLVGNTVCYVHSVAAARDWLVSLDVSPLTHHPGLLLIPFVFVICITFSWFCASDAFGEARAFNCANEDGQTGFSPD